MLAWTLQLDTWRVYRVILTADEAERVRVLLLCSEKL